MVDQFGYPTVGEKIAVLRSPQTGFDTATMFTPGVTIALVDAHSSQKLLEAAASPWNGGATDATSGDKAWWFDFSSVTTPGDYFVLDETQAVRSDVFRISDDVYRDVMAQAMRMYFYQRSGFAKTAQYAGAGWVDGASFTGPLQDLQCSEYDKADAAATEKDLHGGWFDAGDLNRYTNWGASDVVQLLRAYRETPGAFLDDYNIPESGNGVPDLLDEVQWELDWLVRMQNADGSLLTVIGEPSASPPSAATGPCLYGTPSTSAAFSGAAVFALASMVYGAVNPTTFGAMATDLASRAQSAWTWGMANPNIKFHNNDQASGTQGLAAGDQEVVGTGASAADYAYAILMKQLMAAVYLFQLTGDPQYQAFFDANYAQAKMVSGYYAGPFAVEEQDTLLEYTRTKNATSSVVQDIQSKYQGDVDSSSGLGTIRQNSDPYMAYLSPANYTWGSNSVKASQGIVFYDLASYGIDPAAKADAIRAASRYVHYLHGANPLSLVYLSNMGDHGAAKSVTRFYHSWFAHGSALWDAVGVSTYGPPPGYLTGGPNPSYAWDGCCPSNCGTSCGAAPLSPPSGQPAAKSYLDFNDSWPLDSWQVTEPDDGYQAAYVRLLAKFVQ